MAGKGFCFGFTSTEITDVQNSAVWLWAAYMENDSEVNICNCMFSIAI